VNENERNTGRQRNQKIRRLFLLLHDVFTVLNCVRTVLFTVTAMLEHLLGTNFTSSLLIVKFSCSVLLLDCCIHSVVKIVLNINFCVLFFYMLVVLVVKVLN